MFGIIELTAKSSKLPTDCRQLKIKAVDYQLGNIYMKRTTCARKETNEKVYLHISKTRLNFWEYGINIQSRF